jgi:hypothetical protein
MTLAIRNVQMFPLLKFALAALIAVSLSFALGSVARKLALAKRIL